MIKSNKYNLPSMDMLLCFEAVARYASFTDAAEELCLTQSAVSKKIANLESLLGVKLFTRMHRAIKLTDDGIKILKLVEDNLIPLNDGFEDYLSNAKQYELTVSASVSFAYYWLIPRLEDFNKLHPEINVNVISSDKAVDLKKDGSEVAILFGDGNWSNLQATKLVGEVVYAVASPNYVEKFKKITPDNLREHTLIHLKEGVQITDGVDWSLWMDHHLTKIKPIRKGPSLNSYPLVLQAVEAGQGIGLGWDYAIQDKLESGTLCQVFNAPLRTDNGYYFVSPPNTDLRQAARKFRNWIIQTAHNSHSS